MNFKNLIETNFNIEILKLSLIDSHFGTEIYSAETPDGKYFVKKLPIHMRGVENEKAITDFLYANGISVPILLKTKDNKDVLKFDDFQITIQTFIEGKGLRISSATGEFLASQAELLGKINLVLKDYKKLPVRFDKKFVNKKIAVSKCKKYKAEFETVKANCTESVEKNWLSQIKHLERISSFKIDTRKLTYANSHGDFNIRQIVASGENLTVVDWSSACKLPICLEVMTSYVFATAKSKNGYIDANEFKEYIATYSKYFKLNDYDLKMMPYVFYFWHAMCNYQPDEEIAKNYKSLAALINNLLDWLYDNVDGLSKSLRTYNKNDLKK